MMRLTPHTYRRLAFLASWKVMSEINDLNMKKVF